MTRDPSHGSRVAVQSKGTRLGAKHVVTGASVTGIVYANPVFIGERFTLFCLNYNNVAYLRSTLRTIA